MRLLIEKGLMFGNLIPVESPALVERYNRALAHLTGRTTALPDFHIDISGFSPEIGDEFDDDLYLNHAGVNRQFILLTTEQKRAPLLNAKFSTSRGILRQFITANEPALFALSARDAVAGELVNSIFTLDAPEQLLDIRRITIEADTTQGTVATAARLTGLIDRFKTEPDAWWDDVLIAEMIGLAQQTGDLTRNPVSLRQMSFVQENFWTSHFGGLYVFRGVDKPAIISVEDRKGTRKIRDLTVIPFRQTNAVARFLDENRLVEPIVKARGVDAVAILRQKMDFIVAEVASLKGEKLEGATRRDLRALGRRYGADLPPEWQGLAALVRWAEEDGAWPTITSDHPAYFYTLRATRGPDADLVNMLLAELSPLDVRQLFICHKEAFYTAYRTWPEAKQAYVADFLHREYMVDKAGTRDALFGAELSMQEPDEATATGPWFAAGGASDEMIGRVGPWGAVRRR
ncbi:MAG: hypothetical protein JJT81_10160 [Rubellimicrobium sp.]|nr:hypothetical protein [Rubellimicrobium sp.]